MTTLDLTTLITAFLWGLVSAGIGAWAMARAQRRRQPPPVPPVPPAPKPITTTEALKLAANFLATQKPPLRELSPEERESYSKFFARTAEETGVLPPSRAPDSPTPPTEGQDTNQPPGAALKATGLSVEDIDPAAVKRAIWGQDFAPLPHTYEPDPTINVPTCTHCGKWPSHHNHTTGDTQ